MELVKETLRRAQKRYEKQVNKNRRQVSFKVGQKVWLNVKIFTLPQGLTPKFMAKFAGPFPVVKQVFDDVYKLALPPKIKVHPVFHVSFLKEYFEDLARPEHEQVLRPIPELVENHEEYEVETILNKCKLRSRGHGVFGEVARIPCEGSNMGTKFGLGECQEGGARL